jgi:hypothetical protein
MLPSARPLDLIRRYLTDQGLGWLCVSAYGACRAGGQRANTVEAEYLAAQRRIITGHLPVAQKREEPADRFPAGALGVMVPVEHHADGAGACCRGPSEEGARLGGGSPLGAAGRKGGATVRQRPECTASQHLDVGRTLPIARRGGNGALLWLIRPVRQSSS